MLGRKTEPQRLIDASDRNSVGVLPPEAAARAGGALLKEPPPAPRMVRRYEIALEAWDEIWREQIALRLGLSNATTVMAILCVNLALADEALEGMASGLVVKSPNNYPIQNPFLAVFNRATETILKCCSELGRTPAAVARILSHDLADQLDLFTPAETPAAANDASAAAARRGGAVNGRPSSWSEFH